MKKFLIDIFSFLIISSLTALAVFELRINFGPNIDTSPAVKFVVIDTDYILKESMKILRLNAESGHLPSAEMPQRGSALGGALMEEIKKYTQQGYIVFRSDSMIGYPQSNNTPEESTRDITDSVYKKLLASSVFSDLKNNLEDSQ